MSLASLQSRWARLNYEIAKAVEFAVCIPHTRGYFDLEVLRASSTWARRKYSFAELPRPGDHSLLWCDLNELARRGWLYLDANRGRDSMNGFTYVPDPTKWQIGLKEDGLAAAEDFETPWWKRAYDKEPVTFIQVVATVIISSLSFVGGYFVGKKTEPKPEESKIVQPEKKQAPQSTQPSTTQHAQ